MRKMKDFFMRMEKFVEINLIMKGKGSLEQRTPWRWLVWPD